MTPIQSIYYACGQLAYAIAMVDGVIQKEERQTLHNIFEQELKENKEDMNVAEIIFQILSKDGTDVKTAYDWAMKELRSNSHFLTVKRKSRIISIVQKVAEAFPPVTAEEKLLIHSFVKEVEAIQQEAMPMENVSNN